MLGVGDGVADDGLEEGLEDSAGLLVDESGDALDTSSVGVVRDANTGPAS